MPNEKSLSVLAKVLFLFIIFLLPLIDRPKKNYIDAREFPSGGGILEIRLTQVSLPPLSPYKN